MKNQPGPTGYRFQSSHMPLPLVIEAEGLGRRFGARTVLEGVSIDVRQGEVFGVVGPDGAGKTTLLQILAGILRPSFGTCRVLGQDVRRRADRVQARVGYMSQGFSLYDRLTIAENISFAAGIRDVPKAAFEARKTPLLKMAGLERFEARREGALSGGMRKKLALCANLIHEPPLLILDEPSLGVDPLSRRELWRMLEDVKAVGRSIIFATSYMDEADGSDRVLLLRDGRPLAVGSPAELRTSARQRVYRVTTANPGALESQLTDSDAVLSFQKRTLGEYRVQLAEAKPQHFPAAKTVAMAEPTMEDVFTVASAPLGRSTSRSPSPKNPMPTSDILVAAQAITQRFGSFVAVDNVSLEIKAGEVLGLLGPNGAGKTTLMRILCGLLSPTEGRAQVGGLDVARQSELVRATIGYVSQKFSLFTDLTSQENLSFFTRAYGVSPTESPSRIAWACERAGFPVGEEGLVRNLSSALRQRLALACAIVHRPRVLFLDEPTSGVDPLSRFRFWRLISTLAADGVAVIVSTHYLEEATYCDRLGLMMDGRMIALGSLAMLEVELGLNGARVEDVFMGFIDRERKRLTRAA